LAGQAVTSPTKRPISIGIHDDDPSVPVDRHLFAPVDRHLFAGDVFDIRCRDNGRHGQLGSVVVGVTFSVWWPLAELLAAGSAGLSKSRPSSYARAR
jgi:hypothetical protein